MSRIDDLIRELCPNGVKHKKLGEIVEILDSQRRPVTKSQRQSGKYPYYGANGIQDFVSDYIFDGFFILLGEDGSVINKDNSPVLNWATGKIWVNNHAHILAEKSGEALLRYIYFVSQTIDVSQVVKGNIPKITQQNLRAFRVPVPPLAVQEEIVRILDSFTSLEAELEAELEARKKQYEYYRDELLTFSQAAERVRWLTLANMEDAQMIKLGRGKVISKRDIENNPGNYPVYSSSAASLGEFGRYGDYLFDDERITWSIDGGGRFFYRPAERYSVTNVSGWLKVFDKSISTKFLFYQLETLWTKKSFDYTKKAHPSVIRREYTIAIPPITEQQRIVSILDKFDCLVKDLSSGLPAEIAARHKQYEYYRDGLLSFKELVV